MAKITKPDVENTDLKYWERVLSSHGLGVDQPLTDNSTDPSAPDVFVGDDFAHLRKIVDKGDRFMEAHEIKKVRGLYDSRDIPEWTQNDKRVGEILLLAFPKLRTSEGHRRRASRWMKFIYFYYRLALPRPIIMKEMRLTNKDVDTLVQSINRASRGLRADGSGRRMRVLAQPVRESGERGNEPVPSALVRIPATSGSTEVRTKSAKIVQLPKGRNPS